MARCGLLFSPGQHDKGIVTGDDILALNLSDTYLVVLSSCQSALGTLEFNEGVAGLRRAYEISDAHNLICSLWESDDCATFLLMSWFYHFLIVGKAGLSEALNKAKQRIRGITGRQLIQTAEQFYQDGSTNLAEDLMDKVRASGGQNSHPFEHPYYWAGFILIRNRFGVAAEG